MYLRLLAGKLEKGTRDSAAFDLFYVGVDPIHVFDQPIALPTGVRTEFEPGYVAIIKEKSGHSLRGLEVKAGVIDADYRDEWKVILRFPMHLSKLEGAGRTHNWADLLELNEKTVGVKILPGQKIAQVMFFKLPIIDVELKGDAEFVVKDEERKGGFGSTGES